MQSLLTPFKLGSLELPNRVVLAPMTRNRADNAGNVPTDLIARYYVQRASAGLLISEGTFVSKQAIGFINVPGLYSAAQVEGWKTVTSAVHDAGGRIFAQLWHTGAVSHPDLLDGALPVSPSGVNPMTKAYTHEGFKPTVAPRPLETAEVQQIVTDFRLAAARAKAASFDGVELHGANGYLIQQFLARSTNQRNDEYGGNIENRTRFLFQVIDAVAREFPRDRIGLKLTPTADHVSGVEFDQETVALYTHLVETLNANSISYLHIAEPINGVSQMPAAFVKPSVAAWFRRHYRGAIIGGVDYTQESGNTAIARGDVDLVAFGRSFIANPDLVQRFQANAPLAMASRDTFYTGGAKGYVDYPAMREGQPASDAYTRVAPGESFAETRAKTRA